MKKTKNDFNKIKNIEDLCSMVEKRIPNNSENNSEYFTAVNRILLKAGYIYCILKDRREIDDLLKLIKSSIKELEYELKDLQDKFNICILYTQKSDEFRQEAKKIMENVFHDTDFTLEKDGVEIKKIIRDARQLISYLNPYANINHTSFLEAVSNPDFFKN
ncbi:hypothetical protein [Aliarcobacter cryaerophilus]|uniref:hypothetical protein n=1 Tax=Aliarcobacter cryaerophilus TaxID=28198 RepID=UPI0021B24D71|nr:hypothetical protein [Aliarcobacter cryaerophilus]MCT7510950.1 hypothetical protein [Aliarcobacter cryaerophilus]